ncbi:MAG: carboxylesterase/lipase family protein [Bryobacteraceae bacterium]
MQLPDGVLEGVISADGLVRTFKGIPYAAPPVGPLRWKPPQAASPWTGVRKSVDYGARCMQGPVYPDMVFHDDGPSEDCLYLNLWMPAHPRIKLPVMVWIYGGGFAAGSTSEPRQDGGNLSKKGVLVVSMNYRLGIFGFFTHPGPAEESEHHAAGNYGLLDQLAALKWVHRNIALFGGDPDNVTIFGESAGSFSVSALMASPLSRGLFKRAIGESGAYFGPTLPLKPLAQAEADDVKFAESSLGTPSLAKLRAMPAGDLMRAAMKERIVRFAPDVDGYFLPGSVASIFAGGRQVHIPLLAGWNRDEGSYRQFFRKEEPTPENYAASARSVFGEKAGTFLKLYPGKTAAEAKRSAQDFAGDRFIAYSTWKWIEMQVKTGDAPVYRYEFDDAPPLAKDAAAKPGQEPTAHHAAEIEFVFEALQSKKLPWRAEDRRVSDLMSSYWTNFAKTGDPNGPGLPRWPAYGGANNSPVMHFTAESQALPAQRHARYEFLDALWAQK